jgi:ribonuclease HI
MKVFDIKNLIKRLNEKVKFHIKRIRGHIGIDDNERANALAREAADMDLNDSIYNYFPCRSPKDTLKQ